LNWEHPKTQKDISQFFTENAPIFDDLIVDDFFCTGDTSQQSEQARGARSWGEYRRDLLTSLAQSIMVKPAHAARGQTRLIVKFPQWYDRFQFFGYDPQRLCPQFDQVWVGTEVRDPKTRRMGFVQPTEGFMNFRWLASQNGEKVQGAWFDHIECSAQNFVDQAYQSVLAGARELTLFHLGDLMEGHPGDVALAKEIPNLIELASRVQGKKRVGIAYYMPPNSDGDDNLFLADYLGMLGLPILPVAAYPSDSPIVFLPVHAALDPELVEKVERHLRKGGTVVFTPALMRALGPKAERLAGVYLKDGGQRTVVSGAIPVSDRRVTVSPPLEIDASLMTNGCHVELSADFESGKVPFLTTRSVGVGKVVVLNVRTFATHDYYAGEWLLAPRVLGLPTIPQEVADAIRAPLLEPLKINLRAPAGVELVLFGKEKYLYNFLDKDVPVVCDGAAFALKANTGCWRN
jgi:hypothetical protein